MQGIFELASASDLLQKLHYEFEQLKREPNNTYVAFNFFVTAEHLLDWLYPGNANKSRREQVRNSSVLLQICSHLANGAKHFKLEAKHHQSVSTSGRSVGMFPPRLFPPRLFPPRLFPNGGLFVQLKGDAEKAFGPSVPVMDLATKVLEFWENHQDLKMAGCNA